MKRQLFSSQESSSLSLPALSELTSTTRRGRRVEGCLCGAVLCVLIGLSDLNAQEAATKKIEIVSVTGCLREQGAGNWMLVAATDPVPSVANQATAKELPATAPDGKNSFKLIGVSEFAMPQKRDKTVVIRGLFIKATPVSRLNVTSVAEALPGCAPSAPK